MLTYCHDKLFWGQYDFLLILIVFLNHCLCLKLDKQKDKLPREF